MEQYILHLDQTIAKIRAFPAPLTTELCCIPCATKQTHIPVETYNPEETSVVSKEDAQSIFSINTESELPWVVHCPSCSDRIGTIEEIYDEDQES